MAGERFPRWSRLLFLAVVLVSLLAAAVPASVVNADSVVTFPDPNLEAAIREAISRPTGDIYQSDLDMLTTLDANERGITSIAGLEHCTSLTKLYLWNNRISDLGPLTGLTGLITLNVARNQVGSISALSGLTSLTGLDLGQNQIGDISPLSALNGLRSLHLTQNHVADLSPLSTLINLVELDLGSNQISSLSPLSGLANLIRLGLDSNQISSLSPVSGLTKLTSLYLGSNQIGDLSPVSGLTSLVRLDLNSNQASDLSPLSGLTNLTWLSLGSNQISDLSPLSGLTKLTSLDLSSNQISDLSPLSGLTNLADRLYLWSNLIADLSPLSGLTKLTQLYLKSNQVVDLSPLSGLASLTHLDLSSNQISSLSALSGMASLAYVDLSNNQVGDLQPLVNNAGMASGDRVLLRENPLSSESIGTCIPALQARGVVVEWDGPANQPPNQPANVSPAAGATGVSLTPALRGSAFSDPDTGDRHAASQWQVTTTAGDYSSPVFDSGGDTYHLASITVPALNWSGTYYWHVRHEDGSAAWSSWSSETSFTTAAAPPSNRPPGQPSNVSPPAGATGVSLMPTLQGSAFSDPDAGDNHAASQWQVRESSGSYSSPAYDSGADAANLAAASITSGLLGPSTTYCWRVRYEDGRGLWSDWSAETAFATEDGSGPGDDGDGTGDERGGPGEDASLPSRVWTAVGIAGVLISCGLAYLLAGQPKPRG